MWKIEFAEAREGTVAFTIRRLPHARCLSPMVYATGVVHLSPSWGPWWAHVEIDELRAGYYLPRYVLSYIEHSAAEVPAECCPYCKAHHGLEEYEACPAYDCGDHPAHPEWVA